MDEARAFEHVVVEPRYQKQHVKGPKLTAKEKALIAKAFKTGPLLQLLSTVRSRRFGMGYQYETGEPETMRWSHGKTVQSQRGPLAYQSAKKPYPLSETEEAILAWAACGPNGVILADLPVTGNMSTWLCWAGRTIPAPCNDVAVDLFIVNDEGTSLYRPSAERLNPLEIESEDDYWKILDWYREGRIKISDKRIDVGWMACPEGTQANMAGVWQYNLNRPGSTWFIPVGDTGFEWVNLLHSMYQYMHLYLTDPETGEPAGCKQWVKPGVLEVGIPIPTYDELLLLAHGHQVGCLVSNLRLAAEAIGLGAWVFCGTIDELVLGGMPQIAKGLGFKYMERDPAKNPAGCLTSVGLPGIKEACVTPSPQFPTPKDMCSYVCDIRYKRGSIFAKDDNWALRNKAPYKPEVMNSIIEHPNIRIADWAKEAVLATVEYIVAKYGCVPAFHNPIQAQFTAQLHHLDLDYYRKFYTTNSGKEPYAMTPQILAHFKEYHPGEADPYAK
jgi:hypothetical protein